MNDEQLIAEAYLQVIKEANTVQIKRIDDTSIEVDGQKKDITNFMHEISDGGNAMMTVWTRRRRDKKVGGQIVAKAGEELVLNGKLGPCAKEVSGVGSPLGPPKERYATYALVTMCVNREGEFHTRHVNVIDIFKLSAGGTIYVIA